MQTQNYPKGGLLDTMCPSTAAPNALRSEQEFPMFPKSRMDTVSVNYCSLSQDFTGSNLSLLTNGSGKETLPGSPFSKAWVRFREPPSDTAMSCLITRSRSGVCPNAK